jgi:CheY-like chemotaxis protein
MTIVVADDNPRVVDLYVDVLAELGHVVHAFPEGETALDAVATLRPDLLIVDRRMPGLDGLEVARRARTLSPDLLILMITASPGAQTAGEAATAGVDRFLSKPCTLEQFTEAVAGLIARKRPAGGASPSGAGG